MGVAPCVAYVTNKQGQKWYKLGGNYNGKYILAANAEYHPASNLSMFLGLQSNPMTEGRENAVVGNVSSSYYTMQISAYLDGKMYCNYTANAGNVTFQSGEVSLGVPFDDLEPGNHSIRVKVTDSGGGSQDKTVNFTVLPAVKKPYIAATESVGGDEYSNEEGGKQVKLACGTGGASIYYTLDGTEPTKQSTLYTLPFKVTQTCTVSARAFKEDKVSAIFRDVVTVNTAKEPEIVTEDTPEGTRVTIGGEENAQIYYMVSGTDHTFKRYKKPFTLTDNTSVTAYARKTGCKDSGYVSKDVEVHAPAKPELIAPADNTKYAQNSSVIFKWHKITNAADYSVKIFYNGELEDTIVVEDANASVLLEKAGTYTVKVTARNAIGSSEESEPLGAVSVAPVKVTFEDWDGSVVSEQVVDFGGDAVKPTDDPARKGYFFLYWDGSWTNVQEDTTISAVYRIRSYVVTFYDQNENLIGHKQSIEYGGEADVPVISTADLPEGFTFLGWNIQAEDPDSACDLAAVDSNMTVRAIVGWFDSELPLVTTITSATRNDGQYTDEGSTGGNYNVTVHVKNYPDSDTTAMLRVSLKTAEGKMVKTESRTISLKANATETFDFTLNYSGTATKVEAVTLGYNGDYKTGSAYSEAATADVTVQSGTVFNNWSDWDETVPAAKEGRVIEQKTVYRSRTKQTTTSTSATLSGWTAGTSTWKTTGSGTHYYFVRPSGFNGSAYTNYASSGISSYETATTKRTVSGATHNSYIYWKWSAPYCYGQGGANTYIGSYYGEVLSARYGAATVWEAFESAGAVETYTWSDSAVIVKGHSNYGSNWWKAETFKQTYTDQAKYTTFYKYSDWSAWQDAAIAENDSTQVETKTLYRYKDKDVPVFETIDPSLEDTSGKLYRFTGSLDVDNSLDLKDKVATVMVYKGKNSDPNESQLQYVGQTKLLEGNAYDISFKTKDEPTLESGDYIVSLGVQGALGLVNIGLIEAPVPEYTVNFYSGETLVDTQTVPEGGNATLPDAPQKDGYKFVVWSETGRNVHGDLNISAVYTPKTYAVAFVDWVNGTVEPFALEYGSDLTELAGTMRPEADGHTFLYWDKIHDGQTTVAENMVISAVYQAATYTVRFYDRAGEGKQLLATRQVEYGKEAEPPEDPTYSDRVFLGWSTDVKWWNVRSDMDVYPILAYYDSAAEPIPQGGATQYGMQDKLTLQAGENATIYYTTDGTDPVPGENGTTYTGPIDLTDESVVIKAIATEENKNNSEIVEVTFNYSEGNDYELLNNDRIVARCNPLVRGGDEVTLKLNIKNNPGLEGYVFIVECDPAVYYMDYDEDKGFDYSSGEAAQGGMYFVAPAENGWKVMWFSTEAAESDGSLFELHLKVADGVAYANHPITVSYSDSDMITVGETEFDDFDADFGCSVSGAQILGDVNGDEAVSLADVILIAKFKAGLHSITEPAKLTAADVNGDGNVTLADVVALARFIIGLEKLL